MYQGKNNKQYSDLCEHENCTVTMTSEGQSQPGKHFLCNRNYFSAIFGSFLSLVFACLSIRDGVFPSKGEEVVLGVSAMLYWFGLLGIC